jgi:hypothetical protein
MQKPDILSVVLALGVVLVIALVIKPVVTGQPVNLGISLNPTPIPTEAIIPVTEIPTQPTPEPTIITSTPTQIPTPTALPTWNGSSAQTIQFVDPSTYGLNLTGASGIGSRMPLDNASIRGNLTTFATFSGQFSGTTQLVNIPFPYWELWYTVEPITSDVKKQSVVGSRYTVTPTQGIYRSGIQGSYSTALPTLTIQVVDADHFNKTVRTISPPGGIDPTLWTTDITTDKGVTIKASDPRPWKEKFYEGQRSYYFVIQASILKSYKIDIKIPSSYVGKI